MNDDVFAGFEARGDRRPDAIELVIGDADVVDRKVESFEATRFRFPPQTEDREQIEFVRLDKRHQRGGAPRGDRIEIGADVSLPGAVVGVKIRLARRESDSDPASPARNFDRVDSQGVGLAGLDHLPFPFQFAVRLRMCPTIREARSRVFGKIR